MEANIDFVLLEDWNEVSISKFNSSLYLSQSNDEARDAPQGCSSAGCATLWCLGSRRWRGSEAIPEPQADEESRNIGNPGRATNVAKGRALQSLLAGTGRGGSAGCKSGKPQSTGGGEWSVLCKLLHCPSGRWKVHQGSPCWGFAALRD